MEQAVRLFQRYAADGDNGSLRAFASQALPTLQKDLSAAQGPGTRYAGSQAGCGGNPVGDAKRHKI